MFINPKLQIDALGMPMAWVGGRASGWQAAWGEEAGFLPDSHFLKAWL